MNIFVSSHLYQKNTLVMDTHIPHLTLNENDDLPSIDCNYKTPDSFKDESTKYKKSSFSILNFNIRSCRRNFANFYAFLSMTFFTFSLIILCETWLNEDIDIGFDIAGYEQINLYRNSHGGGLKVYYNCFYEVNIIKELSFISNILEILTFSIIGKNFKYIVLAIYRPPSSNPITFSNILFDNILSKIPEGSDIILVGDINLNLLNPLKLSCIDYFIDNLLSLSFFPVIDKPAKINGTNTANNYSLIDQIWTNFKKGSDHLSGIINFPLTDHMPIYYYFNSYNTIINKKFKFRRINQNAIQNFISCFYTDTFRDVFLSNNPNTAFNLFHDILKRIFDSCFPLRTKKVKSRDIDAPWVTCTIKNVLRKNMNLLIFLEED